jgi:hypothetical protein
LRILDFFSENFAGRNKYFGAGAISGLAAVGAVAALEQVKPREFSISLLIRPFHLNL